MLEALEKNVEKQNGNLETFQTASKADILEENLRQDETTEGKTENIQNKTLRPKLNVHLYYAIKL